MITIFTLHFVNETQEDVYPMEARPDRVGGFFFKFIFDNFVFDCFALDVNYPVLRSRIFTKKRTNIGFENFVALLIYDFLNFSI